MANSEPVNMSTILAVAVGDDQATYVVSTDPPTDPVRPYIYGLIYGLKQSKLIIGTHYKIDYRECSVNDLKTYAFNNVAATVIFCMSSRVVDEAVKAKVTQPIVGIASDDSTYTGAIYGYSPRRVDYIIDCYHHFFASVPALNTVYVLHDKDHGPSKAAYGNLPNTVKPIDVSNNINKDKIPDEITRVWKSEPNPKSAGILVLPVDRCFGVADKINKWGLDNSVPIFWPVTDWVFSTTSPEPSAFGGYGVSQNHCGEVMGAMVATILHGGTPIQKWAIANIDDPVKNPNTEIDWAVSQAAAKATGTKLVHPLPAVLQVR